MHVNGIVVRKTKLISIRQCHTQKNDFFFVIKRLTSMGEGIQSYAFFLMMMKAYSNKHVKTKLLMKYKKKDERK